MIRRKPSPVYKSDSLVRPDARGIGSAFCFRRSGPRHGEIERRVKDDNQLQLEFDATGDYDSRRDWNSPVSGISIAGGMDPHFFVRFTDESQSGTLPTGGRSRGT